MRELPPDLFQAIKKTLKLCDDVFLEHKKLHNLFRDSRLEAWQELLPEARSLGERIEETIHYLWDQKNHQGVSALYLLLSVLSERYPSTTQRYISLRQHMVSLHPPTASKEGEEVAENREEPTQYDNPFWSVRESEHIQRCGRSVAKVRVQQIQQGIVVDEEIGTAWLIAPGLAVTCWHVIATLKDPQQPLRTVEEVIQQITHLQLVFESIDKSGDDTAYRIAALEYPRQNAPTHDFAVLSLENRRDHPYDQFAYLPIERDTPLTKLTRLSILQHPWGDDQQGTHGHFVSSLEGQKIIRYTAETRLGSSGSPVFSRNNTWPVIAMHNKYIESIGKGEGLHINTILNTLQKEQLDLYEKIARVQFPNEYMPEAQKSSQSNHHSPLPKKPSGNLNRLVSMPTKKSAYQDSKYTFAPTTIENYAYFQTITNNATSSLLCVAFTQNSLAFSGRDGTIALLGIPTLHEIATIPTHMPAVTSLASSSDGQLLAVGSSDGTVLLWDLKTAQRYRTQQLFTDWVSSLHFSAQGETLVCSSENGQIKIVAVSDGVTQRQWAALPAISGPVFALQSRLIASPTELISSGNTTSPLTLPATWIVQVPQATCFLFSPQGDYLVCGTENGIVVVYDVVTQRPLHTLTFHKKAVRCLAFHPEGTLVASAGDDQTIHLWQVRTGKHVQAIKRDATRIQNLAFSPDGQLLASLDSDPKLILWTAGTP